MPLAWSELEVFLNQKTLQYNTPSFIDTDPISVPHQFSKKEDIEISGFLTATLSWGNRKAILKSAKRLMNLLDNAPYDFVKNHQKRDLKRLEGFVHRTFNAEDLKTFLKGLNQMYAAHGGLEGVFSKYAESQNLQKAIHHFKHLFFEVDHFARTEKHLPDPLKNSAAKRINMFLRWMVRKDNAGVDFGLWKTLMPCQLSCPLDVHSGNVARKLGLLARKQNDALAVLELDAALRKLDPIDPVKYDFALFGLGVFEKF